EGRAELQDAGGSRSFGAVQTKLKIVGALRDRKSIVVKPQAAISRGDVFEQGCADFGRGGQFTVNLPRALIEQLPGSDGLAAGRLRRGSLEHTAEKLRLAPRDGLLARGPACQYAHSDAESGERNDEDGRRGNSRPMAAYEACSGIGPIARARRERVTVEVCVDIGGQVSG